MIKHITVVGAGTMGHGIAETFAMHGYKVHIYEVYEPARNSVMGVMKQEMEFLAQNGLIAAEDVTKALDNIAIYDNLKEAAADADYVIEAIVEKMEVKQNLFAELDGICKPECIFASNTSSLPLSGMIEKLPESRKARTMVCHWYNPAHLMPIAELSFFGNMDEETYQKVAALYESAGKQTVKVLKDVPGLVANRIQQGVAREVFSIMEQGLPLRKILIKR